MGDTFIKTFRRKLAQTVMLGLLVAPIILESVAFAEEVENGVSSYESYTELVEEVAEERVSDTLVSENVENNVSNEESSLTEYVEETQDENVTEEFTGVNISELEGEVDRIDLIIKELTENLSEEEIERQREEVERMKANHSPAPYYNYVNIYGDRRPATSKEVYFQRAFGKLIYDKLKEKGDVPISMVIGLVGESFKWDYNAGEEKILKEVEKVQKDLGIVIKGLKLKDGDLKDNEVIVKKVAPKYFKNDKEKTKKFVDLYEKLDLKKFDGEEFPELYTIYDRLLDEAFAYVGINYVWGGKTPAGFDCSGYVSWVFANLGIHIPAYTVDAEVYGYQVPLDQLQVGDLLFFGDYGQTDHIAIYIGGNQYIHSSTINGGVGVYTLDGYSPHFARRVIN